VKKGGLNSAKVDRCRSLSVNFYGGRKVEVIGVASGERGAEGRQHTEFSRGGWRENWDACPEETRSKEKGGTSGVKKTSLINCHQSRQLEAGLTLATPGTLQSGKGRGRRSKGRDRVPGMPQREW